MLIQLLEREFSQRNRKNPAYSLRSFAKALGVNSGTLSSIMSGKRPLSARMGRKLIDSLNIPFETRKQLLLSLVDNIDSSKNPKDEYHALDSERIEMTSNWEYFAVLSILQTKLPAEPRSPAA